MRRTTTFLLEFLVCLIHDFPFVSFVVDISINADQSPYMAAYMGGAFTNYIFQVRMVG
jgi:hypothetical protein